MAEYEITRKKDGAVAGIDAPFAMIAIEMLGWKPEECEIVLKKESPFSFFKILYFRPGPILSPIGQGDSK